MQFQDKDDFLLAVFCSNPAYTLRRLTSQNLPNYHGNRLNYRVGIGSFEFEIRENSERD